MVLKSLQFTALFFFGKGIMAVLVKSSGHFSSSYISLQISQSSCVAFSPRLFNISDGISSTPAAFPSFISDIANNISLFNTSGPATSSSTSSLSSTCKSSIFGFPSLSYKDSIYCLHVSLTSSGSFTIFPALSLTLTFLFVIFFFHVSFATLAYTKSDLPLESSSSSSAHSLLHHSSFALAASLRSSLFSCLYICLLYSSFLFFQFLLSSILFVIIYSVIQDFFILSFFS